MEGRDAGRAEGQAEALLAINCTSCAQVLDDKPRSKAQRTAKKSR